MLWGVACVLSLLGFERATSLRFVEFSTSRISLDCNEGARVESPLVSRGVNCSISDRYKMFSDCVAINSVSDRNGARATLSLWRDELESIWAFLSCRAARLGLESLSHVVDDLAAELRLFTEMSALSNKSIPPLDIRPAMQYLHASVVPSTALLLVIPSFFDESPKTFRFLLTPREAFWQAVTIRRNLSSCLSPLTRCADKMRCIGKHACNASFIIASAWTSSAPNRTEVSKAMGPYLAVLEGACLRRNGTRPPVPASCCDFQTRGVSSYTLTVLGLVVLVLIFGRSNFASPANRLWPDRLRYEKQAWCGILTGVVVVCVWKSIPLCDSLSADMENGSPQSNTSIPELESIVYVNEPPLARIIIPLESHVPSSCFSVYNIPPKSRRYSIPVSSIPVSSIPVSSIPVEKFPTGTNSNLKKSDIPAYRVKTRLIPVQTGPSLPLETKSFPMTVETRSSSARSRLSEARLRTPRLLSIPAELRTSFPVETRSGISKFPGAVRSDFNGSSRQNQRWPSAFDPAVARVDIPISTLMIPLSFAGILGIVFCLVCYVFETWSDELAANVPSKPALSSLAPEPTLLSELKPRCFEKFKEEVDEATFDVQWNLLVTCLRLAGAEGMAVTVRRARQVWKEAEKLPRWQELDAGLVEFLFHELFPGSAFADPITLTTCSLPTSLPPSPRTSLSCSSEPPLPPSPRMALNEWMALRAELRELPEIDPALLEVTSVVMARGATASVRLGVLDVQVEGKTQEEVAIKFIKLWELADSRCQKQFVREALILSANKHPNIVKFIGVMFCETEVGLVLEKVPMNLHEVIEGKMIESQFIYKLACGLINGLSALHSHQFIHRDIKPENLLLDPEHPEFVKICDFNISKDQSSRSTTCSIGGTLPYLAPECFLSDTPPPPTRAYDIYAYGVVLRECLVHKRLWPDWTIHRFHKLFAKQGGHPPLELHELPMHHDPLLQALVMLCNRCMSLDPKERQTCAEICTFLESLAPPSKHEVQGGQKAGALKPGGPVESPPNGCAKGTKLAVKQLVAISTTGEAENLRPALCSGVNPKPLRGLDGPSGCSWLQQMSLLHSGISSDGRQMLAQYVVAFDKVCTYARECEPLQLRNPRAKQGLRIWSEDNREETNGGDEDDSMKSDTNAYQQETYSEIRAPEKRKHEGAIEPFVLWDSNVCKMRCCLFPICKTSSISDFSPDFPLLTSSPAKNIEELPRIRSQLRTLVVHLLTDDDNLSNTQIVAWLLSASLATFVPKSKRGTHNGPVGAPGLRAQASTPAQPGQRTLGLVLLVMWFTTELWQLPTRAKKCFKDVMSCSNGEPMKVRANLKAFLDRKKRDYEPEVLDLLSLMLCYAQHRCLLGKELCPQDKTLRKNKDRPRDLLEGSRQPPPTVTDCVLTNPRLLPSRQPTPPTPLVRNKEPRLSV